MLPPPLMAPGPPARPGEAPEVSAGRAPLSLGRPRSEWSRLCGARSAEPFTAAPSERLVAEAPSPPGGLSHCRTNYSPGSLAILKLLFKLI